MSAEDIEASKAPLMDHLIELRGGDSVETLLQLLIQHLKSLVGVPLRQRFAHAQDDPQPSV